LRHKGSHLAVVDGEAAPRVRSLRAAERDGMTIAQYGLNTVVVAALLVGALAISGAVLLIVDMDSPYEGMLVVSPQPMQQALAQMSGP
jgi:hypothetical protein